MQLSFNVDSLSFRASDIIVIFFRDGEIGVACSHFFYYPFLVGIGMLGVAACACAGDEVSHQGDASTVEEYPG